MLKILINNDWFPVVDYQNYFIDIDEEGNQSMQFNIALNEIYHKIVHESIIQDEYNRWLVKSINQLTNSATIICELDMDDWYADYYLRSAEDVKLQTKTINDALNYIKPSHWVIVDKSGSKIKRTLDLEKCTAYDLLMRAKSVYDVQYDIDTIDKTITIIDPYISIDNGVYVTPELNLTSSSYKGDSKSIVTRLYCYGADDLTFADINNGKPYVENTSYKGKPICASWTDGRYTNMESLLEDGKKKLDEMAVPVGSYTLDVIDLQKIDEKYRNLDMKLRSKIHCIIDPEKGIDVEHRVVKKRIYPDAPYQNRITLSNQPRTLAKVWDGLKENIETVKKNGYRYETEIRQTNTEISETAKKTDENTKNIQSVEQKISPEQLMVLVSDSINNGNKLNTMKLIIDILGLTIKNGGIKIYDGKDDLVFYLDEKTKKLVMEGDIKSISGTIANWNISNDGLYSEFEREMPEFTKQDIDKIVDHILGNKKLTNEEINRYDITRDGAVTSMDLVLIERMIEGVDNKRWKYKVCINPRSSDAIIDVTVDRGNGKEMATRISPMSIVSPTIDGINNAIKLLESRISALENS